MQLGNLCISEELIFVLSCCISIKHLLSKGLLQEHCSKGIPMENVIKLRIVALSKEHSPRFLTVFEIPEDEDQYVFSV